MADFNLTGLDPQTIYLAQQTAVVRLHLFVLGTVHDYLNEINGIVGTWAKSAGDGPVTSLQGSGLQAKLLAGWETFVAQYTNLLGTSMLHAAAIPFGALAVEHEQRVLPVINSTQEATAVQPDFEQYLKMFLDMAYRRTHDDGVVLSQRIWNLDSYGRRGLAATINTGVANGRTAWQMAGDVEQFLGAGQDCPRWTRTRLYGLTKADIASGNQTGLIRGDNCAGRGVAYNALRLIRTETQAIHHMTARELYRLSPWVESEKINLSPDHVLPDECDDIANGGDKGDGVYQIGTVYLPVHPHCLCYTTPVTMSNEDFVRNMRGWLDGQPWAAMDSYRNMLGDLSVNLTANSVAASLANWVLGNYEFLAGTFWLFSQGME